MAVVAGDLLRFRGWGGRIIRSDSSVQLGCGSGAVNEKVESGSRRLALGYDVC